MVKKSVKDLKKEERIESKKSASKNANKDNDKTLIAFLATFLSIIGFIIALITKRDDKYVMYYAKQSLVIFIIAAIASILSWAIEWIPILGPLIKFALTVLIFLLWILSWIYALSGKEKSIPFVSDWAKKIDL